MLVHLSDGSADILRAAHTEIDVELSSVSDITCNVTEAHQRCCCLLVASLPNNMLVYLSDGSDQTVVRAATEFADQTFHFTQSQYADKGPTSPSADPITPGAWWGSHWSANFQVTGMTRAGKRSPVKAGVEPRPTTLVANTSPLGQGIGRVLGIESSFSFSRDHEPEIHRGKKKITKRGGGGGGGLLWGC